MNLDYQKQPSNDKKQQVQSVRQQLLKETAAMTRYLLASGKRVPSLALNVLEPKTSENTPEENAAPSLTALGTVHARLSGLVAPATPRTILLLAEESGRRNPLAFLGKVPLVRRMMGAALLWLILFVGLSLSSNVNESGGNILHDSGFELLMNLLFFVAAAGLGASFAALFKANHYVVQGTFDPKYESSYWIRFVLGIIAGMLLAVLIPLDTGGGLQFGKPLLAMLGGFSAAVVHRILTRLVETVESLVRGSTDDMVAAREQASQIRAEEQYAESRFRIANQLVDVRKQLGDNVSPEEIKRALDRVLQNVVPMDDGDFEENGSATRTSAMT